MSNMQNVGDGQVVTVHYTLTVNGNQVESSRDGDPFDYLHGANNIVPGLEEAMAGRSVVWSLATSSAQAAWSSQTRFRA